MRVAPEEPPEGHPVKRFTFILSITLLAVITTVAMGAGGNDPQVQQLRKQLRTARLDNSDLRQQVDAQNALIDDQADTLTRLRNRIANQPDALDAILARDEDARWQAIAAIWRAAPRLSEGQLCGYDKTYIPGEGEGLTLTSYSFYLFKGC